MRDLRVRHMVEACEQVGVELGALDRALLDGLANWESYQAQVLTGLIHRAYEAGRAARTGSQRLRTCHRPPQPRW
ncbi:hypothetical protein ITP53_11765 [Nonomuraea sp. K274]|uniref:Uncharacterized protein n=1 Tax=Nonomuraea cypriaca TaxID=1187855 RepID=A0A931EZQ4_9ACTN|nr:hypothetical protein [Nonomuraea cypriaca]MBF8186411.1 hypothetical protein [Nonomuraea cypriaca]